MAEERTVRKPMMARRGGIKNGMPRIGQNNSHRTGQERSNNGSLGSRPQTPVAKAGISESSATLERRAERLLSQFLHSPAQTKPVKASPEQTPKPEPESETRNLLKRNFDAVSAGENESAPSHGKQTCSSPPTLKSTRPNPSNLPADNLTVGKVGEHTGSMIKTLGHNEEENKKMTMSNGNTSVNETRRSPIVGSNAEPSRNQSRTPYGHGTVKTPMATSRPGIPHGNTTAKTQSDVARTMSHPTAQHLLTVNNKPAPTTPISSNKQPSSMPQHLLGVNNKPTRTLGLQTLSNTQPNPIPQHLSGAHKKPFPANQASRHKQFNPITQHVSSTSKTRSPSSSSVTALQSGRNVSRPNPKGTTSQNDSNMGKPSHNRSFSFDSDSFDTLNELPSTRRSSRRTRNAPTNYYAKPAGYNVSLSDEDIDSESFQVSHADTNVPSEFSDEYANRSPRNHPCRLVYQSKLLRIIQQPHISQESLLLTTATSNEEERIPYQNLKKRNKSGELCKNLKFSPDESEGIIIHVDFDQEEMNTIYSLITDDYLPNNDLPLQDRLVEAINHSAKSGKPSVPSYIRRLRRLKDFMRLEKLEMDKMSVWEQKLDTGEIKRLSRRISDVWYIPPVTGHEERERYQRLIGKISQESLNRVSNHMHLLDRLKCRSNHDIMSFLSDAKDGVLSSLPSLLRAFPSKTPQTDRQPFLHYDYNKPSALLRSRELGYTEHRGRNKITQTLDDLTSQKWELSKTWKGASGDIMVLSWSPDGTRFASGATTHCADNNMQYNRNNNLLAGDLTNGKLRELPDHRVLRPLPSTGPNANQATFNTVDPYLYTSISAMQWSHCGSRLYTASFDQTVKIWDASTHEKTRCINTLSHPGKLYVMSVSDFDSSLMATGCEVDSPMRLWKIENDGHSQSTPLESISRSGSRMLPSVVSWGSTPANKDLLITGLADADREDDNTPSRGGLLSLWKIGEGKPIPLTLTPSSQAVFDAAWHPSMPIFAVGCSVPLAAKSQGFGKDVQSLIRIYDPLHGKCAVQMYQCPAMDINEVTFCPTNQNYVAAGCTNGITYVWDYRNPEKILHKLRHGQPISDLDPELTREQADVGVRMALWGSNPGQFYTGASDGVVKSWDIRLSPADVFNQDVHRFGEEIMSGTLSPDKTNMLIGDACGGVHILSTAPMSGLREDETTLNYEGASSIGNLPQQAKRDSDEEDSMDGKAIASEMISSGQLIRHPEFGVGQGPRYDGPFASWARPSDTSADKLATTPLTLDVQATQLAGPPVHRRGWLDANGRKHVQRQIQIARVRNQMRNASKRRANALSSPCGSIIDISSDSEPSTPTNKKKFKIEPTTPSRQLLIDLTGDSDTPSFDSSSSEEDSIHWENSGGLLSNDPKEFEEDHWWPEVVE